LPCCCQCDDLACYHLCLWPADWEAVAEEAYNTQAASDQQLALQGEELQQLQAGSGANSTSGTTVQAAGRRLMEEEEEEEGYEEPLLKHIINGESGAK
jgi:hypothetical protein